MTETDSIRFLHLAQMPDRHSNSRFKLTDRSMLILTRTNVMLLLV